jgi:hypothetical protein
LVNSKFTVPAPNWLNTERRCGSACQNGRCVAVVMTGNQRPSEPLDIRRQVLVLEQEGDEPLGARLFFAAEKTTPS